MRKEYKKELAGQIVELFENLLDKKGIEIPCEDAAEQKDRYDGGNTARLYGMEYYRLIEQIESLLEAEAEHQNKEKKYVVYESNGGHLTLATFGENGRVDYIHTGYELTPGQLVKDLQALKDGVDPIEAEWDGNCGGRNWEYGQNPEEVYKGIVSDIEAVAVADNDGVYPQLMGNAAKREFALLNIGKPKLVAFDIKWDLSDLTDEEVAESELPEIFVIPDGFTEYDEISDYLSELTGFCHYGFKMGLQFREQILPISNLFQNRICQE